MTYSSIYSPRKVAVEDPNSPYGLRLLIEDYPFAVDGLKIWSAIKTWVTEYCSFYYKTDQMIQEDTELQSWWKEVIEKGHAEKKDEPWWPQMKTVSELIDSCTIIVCTKEGSPAEEEVVPNKVVDILRSTLICLRGPL